MFAVADELNKTLDEIGEMSVSEFEGWIAYFNKKNGK